MTDVVRIAREGEQGGPQPEPKGCDRRRWARSAPSPRCLPLNRLSANLPGRLAAQGCPRPVDRCPVGRPRAICLEGVPCVFGVPGAQNNEFWDAMKTSGLPYLLVTNETSASVMADASSSRVTGGVGVFSVVPGPGMTNALTGIGEALLDSVPIVGLVTDVDRRQSAPVVPGPLDAQRLGPPADLQGGVRGPPPGTDPKR